MAVFAGLVMAQVVKHLGYKTTWILVLLLIVVAGSLPGLFSSSLPLILAFRVLFGIGYGLAYPLCAMTVQAYIAADKQPKAMGNGTMFMNIGNIIFSLLGGIIAGAVSWQATFYLHAIMALPLLLIFVALKEPISAQLAAEDASTQGASAALAQINATAWAYIASAGLTILFLFAFPIFISAAVAAQEIGGAPEAGYVITASAISGMLAGMIFGRLYSGIGRKSYLLTAIIALAGNATIAFGANLPLFIVGGLLIGFALSLFLTLIFVGISEDLHPSIAGKVTGFTTTSMNLFSFSAPFIRAFLSSLIGQESSPIAPFYFAIGYFALMLIVSLFIKTPKKQ